MTERSKAPLPSSMAPPPDFEARRAFLRQLARSAETGSPELETYRAAFDRASRADPEAAIPREEAMAPCRDAAETATTDRLEEKADGQHLREPRLAIATPSYLLGTAATPPIAGGATIPLEAAHTGPVDAMAVDETAPLGFIPPKGALPFVTDSPSAVPVPSALVEVPSAQRPVEVADATLAPSSEAQSAPLPFVQALRTEAARASAATVEVHTTPLQDRDETLPPILDRAPALPFGRESGEKSTVDETAFVSRDQVFGPATPFVKSPATITLEEYAAFLGELSRDPTKADQVRVRHGIKDEEAQRAIGARFAAELGRDPKRRATFDELLARAKRTER